MVDDRTMVPDATDTDKLFDGALDAMASGDVELAVDRFEALLALEPGHAEACHGLIRALADAGHLDDALRVTQELIGREPEDVLAWTRLSILYQYKGMVAEAEAVAAKAKILGWKMELRSGVETKTDL